MPPQVAIASIFIAFAVVEAYRHGFFVKKGATSTDAKVELIGSGVLLILTQPAILVAAAAIMSFVAPQLQNVLVGTSILLQISLLIIFDDMTQYWWHRASHTFPWLYKLHRAHHNAEYMSVRIVYRNNIFYYAMMPSIWLSGVLIYMGLGWVYAVYLVVKLTVIMGAHSDVRWDAPLYKIAWLSNIMWFVERAVSTPATHSAHHGKHKDDGVTNYKGNFGNLLFFWDVLFGTAKITRQYPEKFGVENLPDVTAAEQLLWPLIQQTAPIARTAETQQA
jgi:sterol desaturase/sphingolipid hydroxylase (fatty acid hydroxylase superfamily)